MTQGQTIHTPYGPAVVSCPAWRPRRVPLDQGFRLIAAPPLASGASRAACYEPKGAAGPGRIDPTPPIGPIHTPYSRSA